MLFRKLISFGKNSYVLSLPKEWVINNKLKKGSTISLDVHNNYVLLSPQHTEESTTERTSISINIEGKKFNEIRISLINAYLLNYDMIELTYKNEPAKIDKIRDLVMTLAGLEIIEQNSNKMIIKYLIDPAEISLVSLLRRIDNMTRSLLSDMADSLESAVQNTAKSPSDDDVNRINFLILRTVRGSLSSSKHLQSVDENSWKLYTCLNVSEQIERVADAQKISMQNLSQIHLNAQFSKQLKSIIEHIKTSFSDVMKAYYQGDKALAFQIDLSHKERVQLCNELISAYIEHAIKNKKNSNIAEHMLFAEVIEQLKTMIECVNRISRIVIDT